MASGAAKRYAQAVFSLAKERGTLDAWQADLARLDQVMADPVVASYLTSPSVAAAEKQRALGTLLADAQVETKNLVQLLIQRQRLDIIPDVVQIFGDMLLNERGIAIAEVTTAEPLGPDQQDVVRARLSRLVGKEIELRARTDPSIIGGIIARVGDQLIDGSVTTQLRRLRARLAAPR
jgi:F-type H+-transporting ATPase subunit delta